ncbi:hypothetical protein LTR74_011541 [Friedmanniomyces endolithicus]|nr:hypothetical protein LTR74_011541 [Friedmanniomyces endolithicus]
MPSPVLRRVGGDLLARLPISSVRLTAGSAPGVIRPAGWVLAAAADSKASVWRQGLAGGYSGIRPVSVDPDCRSEVQFISREHKLFDHRTRGELRVQQNPSLPQFQELGPKPTHHALARKLRDHSLSVRKRPHQIHTQLVELRVPLPQLEVAALQCADGAVPDDVGADTRGSRDDGVGIEGNGLGPAALGGGVGVLGAVFEEDGVGAVGAEEGVVAHGGDGAVMAGAPEGRGVGYHIA